MGPGTACHKACHAPVKGQLQSLGQDSICLFIVVQRKPHCLLVSSMGGEHQRENKCYESALTLEIFSRRFAALAPDSSLHLQRQMSRC
jgi:hypothetical protein